MREFDEKDLENIFGGFDLNIGKVCGTIKIYFTIINSTEIRIYEHKVGTDDLGLLEKIAKLFCKRESYTYIRFEYIPNN